MTKTHRLAIATVLENSLGGDVVWTRLGAGIYLGTLAGAFQLAKTFCLASLGENNGSTSSFYHHFAQHDTNTVALVTLNNAGGSADDPGMRNTSIEIRVYP